MTSREECDVDLFSTIWLFNSGKFATKLPGSGVVFSNTMLKLS